MVCLLIIFVGEELSSGKQSGHGIVIIMIEKND